MNTPFVEISMWRARVPGDFQRRPLPMVQVTRAPRALLMLGIDVEDILNARYRTEIWFQDRAGFRSAWRLARLIAGGRRINTSLIQAEDGDILVRCPRAHRAEAEKSFQLRN